MVDSARIDISKDLETLTGGSADNTSNQSNNPIVSSFLVFRLPGSTVPWAQPSSTGLPLAVKRGDNITWLASGKVVYNAQHDAWHTPRYAIWARIVGSSTTTLGGRSSDGCAPQAPPTIFKGKNDAHSFTVDRDGLLEMAVCHGEWATPSGMLATDEGSYKKLTGAFDVVLIKWAKGVSAKDGLKALAKLRGAKDSLVNTELDFVSNPPTPPPQGWRDLWLLGQGDIFRGVHLKIPPAISGPPRPAIAVRTCCDAGIIQKRGLSFPLTPTTRLNWSWNLSKLPSKVPENNGRTHDYLSVAVEFSNGLDLTYFWSSSLPVDYHYRCPIPTWSSKEFHWVQRSGPAGLGEWHAEQRTVLPDYMKAIGGDRLPDRIVGVWLIANSVFKHGEGVGTFAAIELVDGDERLEVL